MTKRMLIDASHKEETRVAITDGNRLAEYDYESHSRKPLKGSIFLAKVTRVEPSLQAAFVNFGGNRHGFLPFSEIHPDYFRIPVSDREALMAEQEALLKEHDEEEAREEQELVEDEPDKAVDLNIVDNEKQEAPADTNEIAFEEEESDKGDENESSSKIKSESESESKSKPKPKPKTQTKAHKIEVEEIINTDDGEDKGKNEGEDESRNKDENNNGQNADDNKEQEANTNENIEDESKQETKDLKRKGTRRRNTRGRGRRRPSSHRYHNRNVDVVGGDDLSQEQRFRFNLRRKYKIQEVIKRGQIMLIQVHKEERGNKGAAVGTYLSLPGRYCVLMPNSPRAGGVSRKIANQKDRARMRDIVKSLDVPKGMSVIIRTAGVSRTKAEIKRDLDYLMRLWNNIRDLTLESSAPALVYEEADLIKRAVRDLYTRDVEEILVFGDEGYKTARSFMKMMIPSHVKKVTRYKDTQLPLFNRYQIESQISEIGKPEVRLKSGGYLVINPTEALVSIDVNSGKATKGRHIEETALKTNLEAADEVARQLRLRDLGGLVVIDFIDMEDRRNNAKVERRMKEALSSDRARVQVGRISSFGLMELSRQRLSPSLTEAQYKRCPTCSGVGVIPSADAMSITVLRAIEEEGIRARAAQVIVCVNNEVALYILNHKRRKLIDIEKRYDFEVLLRVDDKIPACEYRIEVSKPADKKSKNSDSDNEVKDVQEDEKKAKPSSRRHRGVRSRGRKKESSVSVQPDEQEDVQLDEQDFSREKEIKSQRNKKSRKKVADDIIENASKEAKEEIVVDAVKDEKATSEKKRTPRFSRKKKEKAATEFLSEIQETKPEDKKEAEGKSKKPVTNEKANKEIEKKAERKDDKEADKKDYEIVNKPPKEKKKGWWNML